MTELRFIAPFALLLATASISAGSPQAAVGAARDTSLALIQLQGGLLTVKIQDAPWTAVVREIKRHARIEVSVRGTFTGTLTAEFVAIPLEEGLRRIFRDADVVLFFSSDAPQGIAASEVTHIWLRPKGIAAVTPLEHPPSVGAPEEGPLAVGQEARLAELYAAAPERRTTALRQAVVDPDQTIQMTAVELLNERDPAVAFDALVGAIADARSEIRLPAFHALHQLSRPDDPTVVSVLNAALRDDDVTVKSYALHALAEHGGQTAIVLLRQALRDPDPGIRMLVLEQIGTRVSGRALLHEALRDPDQTVRDVAAFWLKQADLEER